MRSLDGGKEVTAHHSPVGHKKVWQGGGPKQTVLRCDTEKDRKLVKILIYNKYSTKLEEELAPILTVKISAYVDGIEMDKEKGIVGEWQFTGYFNTPKGNVVTVACDEKFIEDLETKAGMQVPLAMLGVVRFNRLGAKTPSVTADARRAKKEKLLAARQRLENDLAVLDKEEDEDIGADLLNKMDVAAQYQDTDSGDDAGNEPKVSEKEKEKESDKMVVEPSQSSQMSDVLNII